MAELTTMTNYLQILAHSFFKGRKYTVYVCDNNRRAGTQNGQIWLVPVSLGHSVDTAIPVCLKPLTDNNFKSSYKMHQNLLYLKITETNYNPPKKKKKKFFCGYNASTINYLLVFSTVWPKIKSLFLWKQSIWTFFFFLSLEPCIFSFCIFMGELPFPFFVFWPAPSWKAMEGFNSQNLVFCPHFI